MRQEHRTEVIVAGHMCLDIIPPMHKSGFRFCPGTLEEVGPAVVTLGGCVSNTGLGLKKLGARVRLVARIGSDALGDLVQLELKKFGETGEGLTKSLDSTSYSVILSPPGGDRMFLHFPGTNDSFTAEDVESALATPAEIFHFGYPPVMRKMFEDDGRELEKIFRQAKQKGLLTSLDMAYPDPSSAAGQANWRRIAARVLPYVDIFLPSYEELEVMLEPSTYRGGDDDFGPRADVDAIHLRRLSETACSMGAAVVGIKLGDRGLYVRTSTRERLIQASDRLSSENWANRELWTSIFKVNVVGTTGSGDATVAGFLYGVLRGFPVEEVCRIACAVGACNVERADALSGILPFDLVERRMGEGWEQERCPAGDGWPAVVPGVFSGTNDSTHVAVNG